MANIQKNHLKIYINDLFSGLYEWPESALINLRSTFFHPTFHLTGAYF